MLNPRDGVVLRGVDDHQEFLARILELFLGPLDAQVLDKEDLDHPQGGLNLPVVLLVFAVDGLKKQPEVVLESSEDSLEGNILFHRLAFFNRLALLLLSIEK